MRFIFTLSDRASEFNSAAWRSIYPAQALRRAGHHVDLFDIEKYMSDALDFRRICATTDILIIQRVMVEESVQRAKGWSDRGTAVVVDFDDAYQIIDDTNQAAKFWKHGEVEITVPYGIKFTKKLDKHPVEQFIHGLQFCRGATMPGRLLKKDWEKHFPCWYVPNYVQSSRYTNLIGKDSRDKDWITIGYGGSMSHVASFERSGIGPALRNVIHKRKNVRVLICGDDRPYKSLPVPPDRKMHQQYVPWYDWPRMMLQFDIGIAPLWNTYDFSRSWIKCLEGGLLGLPTIATKAAPYQEFIDVGIGHFVSNDHEQPDFDKRAEEWEEKLLMVIDNLDEQREIAKSQVEMSREIVDIDRNVHKLEAIYEEIINGISN